jgi:hypothetical protein
VETSLGRLQQQGTKRRLGRRRGSTMKFVIDLCTLVSHDVFCLECYS